MCTLSSINRERSSLCCCLQTDVIPKAEARDLMGDVLHFCRGREKDKQLHTSRLTKTKKTIFIECTGILRSNIQTSKQSSLINYDLVNALLPFRNSLTQYTKMFLRSIRLSGTESCVFHSFLSFAPIGLKGDPYPLLSILLWWFT